MTSRHGSARRGWGRVSGIGLGNFPRAKMQEQKQTGVGTYLRKGCSRGEDLREPQEPLGADAMEEARGVLGEIIFGGFPV